MCWSSAECLKRCLSPLQASVSMSKAQGMETVPPLNSPVHTRALALCGAGASGEGCLCSLVPHHLERTKALVSSSWLMPGTSQTRWLLAPPLYPQGCPSCHLPDALFCPPVYRWASGRVVDCHTILPSLFLHIRTRILFRWLRTQQEDDIPYPTEFCGTLMPSSILTTDRGFNPTWWPWQGCGNDIAMQGCVCAGHSS